MRTRGWGSDARTVPFSSREGPVELALDMAAYASGSGAAGRDGNPKLFAKLAGKAGLSGRACAVVDQSGGRAAAADAAAAEGVLIEVLEAGGPFWSLEDGKLRHRRRGWNALLRGTRPNARAAFRKCVGPCAGRPRPHHPDRFLGLAGRLGFGLAYRAKRRGDCASQRTAAAGFRPARLLGEREGMTFVEGFRPAG